MKSNFDMLAMRVGRGLLLMVTVAACSEAATADSNDPIKLTRDTAVGKRFGSAGPRSCSPKNAPTKGPPSAQQIAAYVICVREKEEGSREGAAGYNFLNLVDNIVVSAVSKARPYNPKEYYLDSPIDVSKPVYDIKGSLDTYSCHWVGPGYGSPSGKNCSVEHQRNAQGVCYLDTFGNWACNLVDRSGNVSVETGVAPPACYDGSADAPCGASQHSGCGLANMRRRAESLGGTGRFEFTPTGSRVVLNRPLLAQASRRAYSQTNARPPPTAAA